MSYVCSGCGEIVIPINNKSKVVCLSCGVLTDLRVQGFVPLQEENPNDKGLPPKKQLSDNTKEYFVQDKEIYSPESNLHIHNLNKEIKSLRKIVPDDYQGSNDDDGLGYFLSGSNNYICPECTNIIESNQIVCIECGYHIKNGNKIRRKFKVLNYSWTEGMNKQTRLNVTILLFFCAVFAGIAAIQTGYTISSSAVILASIFTTTHILWFFGTYGRCDISRKANGKIVIKRHLRIFFFFANIKTIPLDGHDGIKLIQTVQAGTIEYLICLILLIPFVFPGIIWYLSVIQGVNFEVALTKDMGRSVDTLFRSRNENLTKEIAIILRKISKLPLNQR